MKPTIKTIALELERIIPAAPREVFDGWLDPACPGTTWNAARKLILDPKVDGMFFWSYCNTSGDITPHYGRFIVVDRPRKVQYSWMSPNTRGLESIVTVTFEAQGLETRMTLRHENLPDDDGGRGHESGWGHFVGSFADRFAHQ